MANNKKTFRDFIIELLIPTLVYIWVAPIFMGQIWDNVKSDPETAWYTLVTMHVLGIMLGVCWIEFYNCIRMGLFHKKPNR